jgi:hypothetical protein
VPSVAAGQRLEGAGIVGNSGAEGSSLVRSVVGRSGGGVVVDPQERIFTGGGDRILTLDRDGRLLWQTPLPHKDWILGGPTFAVSGKHLYFIAGPPSSATYIGLQPWTLVRPNLCRVEMASGAKPEALATTDKLRWDEHLYPEFTLTSSFKSAAVYLGHPTRGGSSYAVFQVRGTTLVPLFEKTSGVKSNRVAVDEDGNLYLVVDGSVQKVNTKGEPVAGFTPAATLSGYLGSLMLTAGALWTTTGSNGVLARFTRQVKPNPGAVTSFAQAIRQVAHIADGPDGTYYIKSNEALYAARLEEGALKLLRRFGSSPAVSCLLVTPTGYVGVGSDATATMLWFDFENDQPSAPPVRAESPAPASQGIPQGESAVLAYLDGESATVAFLAPPRGLVFLKCGAEPFVEGDNIRNQACNMGLRLAAGEFDGHISAVTRVRDFYFAVDREGNRLCRAPAAEPCKLVPVQRTPLRPGARVTSVSALGANTLLLSEEATVRAYEVAANGAVKPLWQFNTFGKGPDEALGKELHLATSGSQMLVADTQRHRLLLFSFGEAINQPPRFLSQYGQTDKAGDDGRHLGSPTLVSLSGGKAAVFDSANQRVVKLWIR